MIKKIIAWLKAYHLSHAAIVLIGMWPTSILTGDPFSAAMVWIFGYYMREVAYAESRQGYFRALWPGNWPSRHDRIQTAYVVTVSLAVASILTTWR